MKTRPVFLLSILAGLLTLLVFSARMAEAQDSLHTEVIGYPTLADSGIIKKKKQQKPFISSSDSLLKIHSPRRAALYSAVFPGLGQAYNHQYIKIPLMWAGIGVATGVFIFNFNHYITYRDAYRLRLNGHVTHDPRVDIYSPQDLKYLRDGYRQYVDYSVLGFAAVYLYNVLDAIVFGYLYNFDVASPLSKIKFGPVIDQIREEAYVGIGFTYHF